MEPWPFDLCQMVLFLHINTRHVLTFGLGPSMSNSGVLGFSSSSFDVFAVPLKSKLLNLRAANRTVRIPHQYPNPNLNPVPDTDQYRYWTRISVGAVLVPDADWARVWVPV